MVHLKENIIYCLIPDEQTKTSCFTQQLEICSSTKLYRPNNFDCSVTQQNWFHMVTEHTIHPNNFKVTSHISTTVFSQIPSALSVILNFSTSCYRKGAEMVTFFLHPPAKIVTLPLRPEGQKQNLRVLLQVCGGRRCQDPFKSRTTLTQASLSFR